MQLPQSIERDYIQLAQIIQLYILKQNTQVLST